MLVAVRRVNSFSNVERESAKTLAGSDNKNHIREKYTSHKKKVKPISNRVVTFSLQSPNHHSTLSSRM
jgi:hypothetical protein